ncbi:arrestin domain-containing protein 4-like [Denticeps clupeoides]|uniref:Arrestin domain containing 4 n=1 Tax=Denticeps clupeoides TaxID=299321 RepID=A0AAY4BLX7_9TELE|nr:arrestin domain-containing protein 4 [Denticeps clupeoides]
MHRTLRALVVLDDEQNAGYGAGDVLSGRVCVEVCELTAVESIRLVSRGRGRVRQEEAEYFTITQTLLEATEGEQRVGLQQGRHVFPFQLEIPMRPLVSSFDGKYGRVWYTVQAVVRRPSHPDQSFTREFRVVSHVDLNSPVFLTPASKNQEKMIGAWIFTSGPVSLRVNIERTGYCNGESIPIFAEIENCSSRIVVPKAVIYQTQTYLACGKTKSHKRVVACVRGNHVPSGSSDSWNGKTLKIPPVSPSILNSPIIRVEYSLAVKVQIPGAKKLKVELPVVIGTIPFNGFVSRTSSVSSHFSMDMSWLMLALPDLPEAPPNYMDVVSEEEFDMHVPSSSQCEDLERQLNSPVLLYIQEFRFQPPPVYSEVDPLRGGGLN